MSNFDTFNEADEPATRLEPDTVLADRYRLIKQIGRGGMGVVWKAEEFKAGRLVVLKFMPHDLKNFESAVAQLKESFTKIHELQHQHICPVYTLEEDTSLGYYHVMKWLDGETLDRYAKRQPLSMEDVLRILRPVAAALDYAHGNRIVHRDVKPSNIFIVLGEDQKIRDVQVIDFGLASEIRSSMTRLSRVQFDNSGTRPYMAPEQWRARPQSGPTDQYALGVVVYELLSGHLPFDADDAEVLRLAVLQDPPDPIRNMPEHVNAVLQKAMAKDSGERFECCMEFANALGGAEFVETKKPSPRPAAREPSQPTAPGVESLMKRGHLFLEDADWKSADDYFDRVLDIDPEYAPAYIGKLCAELKVSREEQLGDFEKPITEYDNFQKAIRFADDECRTKVEGYDEKIRGRIRQEEYDHLLEKMNLASNDLECQELAAKLRKMNGYKDTVELAEQCDALAIDIRKRREKDGRQELYNRYKQLCEATKTASTEKDWHEIIIKFRAMDSYKDSAELASKYEPKYHELKQHREKQERHIAKLAFIFPLLVIILFGISIVLARHHNATNESDFTRVSIGIFGSAAFFLIPFILLYFSKNTYLPGCSMFFILFVGFGMTMGGLQYAPLISVLGGIALIAAVVVGRMVNKP